MTSKMTLNSWLYLALSDLPEPVQLRLDELDQPERRQVEVERLMLVDDDATHQVIADEQGIKTGQAR